MKKVKRAVIVTFRATEAMKEKLDMIAKEKDWSVSQVCERIVAEYIEKNYSEEHP